MNNKKRVSYIDIAKGLAILCVIIGHTAQLTDIRILSKIIFSFHMPLFFILSGWCMKEERRSTGQLIKVKAKQLLVPYVVVSVVRFLYMLMSRDFSWTLLGKYMLLCLYGNPSNMRADACMLHVGKIGMQWFMLTMFSAQLMYHFLNDISKKYKVPMWMLTLLVSVMGIQFSDYVWLPFGISQAMGVMVFMYIGQVIRKAEIFETKIGKGFISIPIVCLVIWIIAINYGMVRSNANVYYGIFSMVGAVCGTYWIVKLAQGIEHVKIVNSFLKWCGNNSLYILMFHSLDQKVMAHIKTFMLQYFQFPSTKGGLLIVAARCAVVLAATFVFVMLKKFITGINKNVEKRGISQR